MRNSSSGIGVVEIIVVIGVVITVFFAVYELAIVSSASVHAGARKVAAAYLATEGMEVVRIIRDDSWTANITTLTPTTTYYPTLSGSTWTLSTTDPGLIDGIYTRTVVVNQVLRDGNDDIAVTGTVDPKTLRVVADVSWSDKNGNQSVMLETYITDFQSN